MRAIDVVKPGGPEMLQTVETATPRPGTGEVLIQVAAAGVNRPDVLQRMGLYPVPPDASPLPGLEVAGTIIEVGEGVSTELIGQDVCALCNGGGYAQYVAVAAGQVLPTPTGWSMVEAAGIPETYFTVWANVYGHGRLRKGERLLVHGGTSGIGVTAIAVAKAFGSIVVTTAGSTDKCEFCRQRGADLAVDYKEDDFVAKTREHFDTDHPIDVVLDMVGGDYVPRNLSLLRDRGRHVTIAFLRGNRCELDLAHVLRRRLVLTGSTLRPRSAQEKADIASGLREHVWPLLDTRTIEPVVDSTYPLQDAAEAHRRMESSQHVGKIILEV
jgi:putative PIG3 family NAD(P)H quinone oxidoreductase